MQEQNRLFKLYLYGIEINKVSVWLNCVRTFKLYLYGIEIWFTKIG